MNLRTLHDVELWTLIVSDNYRAFIVLFDRHWLRLYKFSQKHINDKEVCEEIIHDLFVNLWNKKTTLTIENIEAYLIAATRYGVYARLQKIKTNPVFYPENIEQEYNIFELNKGQDKIIYAELENEIQEQLIALPQRCREIFLLSRKECLSNDEIAERLSISKRSVENQITIALKHLRGNLTNVFEQSNSDTATYTMKSSAKKSPVLHSLNATLKHILLFFGV